MINDDDDDDDVVDDYDDLDLDSIYLEVCVLCILTRYHTTTTVLQPFFRDHPGEPVPEEKLLDFMVQGKINGGRHTENPAGRHSIRTNQCPPPPSPIFLRAGCPSCRPTNSVKALKATSAFALGRRR